MKLHAMHCGGEEVDFAVYEPFHPQVGSKVTAPYFTYLIEHDDGLVLFDTGAHRDFISDPATRLGPAAEAFAVEMEEGDDVVSQLGLLGVSPADIEHVVLSHLHYDHAGGLEFFPDSTCYVQKRELEFAHWPPVYQREVYLPADFDHDLKWFELEGEYDIFGDGSVVTIPTPGHSAGHQSLLVRLPGKTVLLAADAAYSPRNLELKSLPSLLWSPDAMVASWSLIERIVRRENAELIFTHDLDYATKTKLAPAECYQ